MCSQKFDLHLQFITLLSAFAAKLRPKNKLYIFYFLFKTPGYLGIFSLGESLAFFKHLEEL